MFKRISLPNGRHQYVDDSPEPCCGQSSRRKNAHMGAETVARTLLQSIPDPLCGEGEVAHLHALHTMLNTNPAYPGGDGAGVVYVGGGMYWPGIVIGCRLIREMGCKWPIEVWYRGTCEHVDPTDLRGYDITLIDSDAMANKLQDTRIRQGNVKAGGWEAKLYALTHTTLDRVLFLDGDAYPVTSPCKLFDLLDKAPFVYWHDLDSLVSNNVRWPQVWPSGRNGVPYVQGGQLLIDRAKAWHLLVCAHWMCQHGDHYFSRMFGDQDSWLVLLASGKFHYHCMGPAEWDDNVFRCKRDGKDAIVHRCKGKILDPRDFEMGRTGQSIPNWNLPMEKRVFEIFIELMEKRSPTPQEVFESVYRVKYWGDMLANKEDSGQYVPIIQSLRAQRGWSSAVDVGCGDCHIGRLLGFREYTGVDVVRLNNQQSITADVYRDIETLPSADVLHAKDVLHHWPNDMVVDWLYRIIKAGKWRSVILTNDSMTDNAPLGIDTHLGGFRPLHKDWEPLRGFDLKEITSYLNKTIYVLDLK